MPGLVLALDLSLRTGWAIGRPNEKPRWGVWELGRPDQDGDGRRFSCLASSLEDAFAAFDPDEVIYEAPISRQQTSARLLIGLGAVVEMICSERSIRYCEEHVGTVRKEVIGRGGFRATEDASASMQAKAAVAAWCTSQGWRVTDDNSADALVLLRYRHVLARSRVTA